MESENTTDTERDLASHPRLVHPLMSTGNRVLLGGGMQQYEIRAAQMILKEEGKEWSAATPEERRRAIGQGKEWKRRFFGTNAQEMRAGSESGSNNEK